MLAAFVPGPAQAERSGGGYAGTAFNLYGRIIALDEGAQIIHVAVESPDYLLKYSPVAVQATAETQFKQCEGDGTSIVIGFADLETGRMIRIGGTTDGETYFAVHVVQYVTD